MKSERSLFIGAAILVFAAVSAGGLLSGAGTAGADTAAIINVRVFEGEKVIPSATVLIAGRSNPCC